MSEPLAVSFFTEAHTTPLRVRMSFCPSCQVFLIPPVAQCLRDDCGEAMVVGTAEIPAERVDELLVSVALNGVANISGDNDAVRMNAIAEALLHSNAGESGQR